MRQVRPQWSFSSALSRAGNRLLVAAFLAVLAGIGLAPGTAMAQTGFSAGITADYFGDPPVYNAGDRAGMIVRLSAGSADTTAIGFTVNLPSGMTMYEAPTASQCGGTVSSNSTSFTLTGGSVLQDQTCYVYAYATALPASTTLYSVPLGDVNYTQFARPLIYGNGGSQAYQFNGVQPPAFQYAYDDTGHIASYFYYYPYVTGTQPITLTATGLPPGLAVTDSQTIEGTPTKLGVYPVHLHAANAYGSADADITITILPPILSATMSFTPSSILPGGSSMLKIVLTSTDSYLYNIGFLDNLPAGMTATAPGTSTACNDGTLTVTPTSVELEGGFLSFDSETQTSASCEIDVPVTATAATTHTFTNSTGQLYITGEGTEYFPGTSATLTVLAAAPKITSPVPPGGKVATPYSHKITVTGNAPITLAVTGLPPGLSFNPVSRTISGMPTTAGSYPGTITASNGIRPDDVQRYTIVITTAPLVITTDTLPPITGGSSVNTPIVAAGGKPPYTFVVVGGTLPPGLSLSPSGNLYGVPSAAGTFTFTVQATDAAATTAVHAYTVAIDKGTPTFLFDVAPNPAVSGQPVVITATLVSGGTTPSGQVQVWLAHSWERCPFVAGSNPVATNTQSATLAGNGTVQLSFANLDIDNYQVCGTYAGDTRYVTVNAGPVDLFVIKGALLGTPAVTLRAPAVATAGSDVTALVQVQPPPSSAQAPRGNVMLRANGTVIGTVAVADGVAQFAVRTPATAGDVVLTATYLGDGAYAPTTARPQVIRVQLGPVDPQAVPVPALGTWALAALALLLGFVAARGAAHARRR
ncbi:MAG: Ig-like domain repeat protein [Proteobacteria bacterium]|nr:Ig-like domain repeat protein [Pseudomonadota bacterium]